MMFTTAQNSKWCFCFVCRNTPPGDDFSIGNDQQFNVSINVVNTAFTLEDTVQRDGSGRNYAHLIGRH